MGKNYAKFVPPKSRAYRKKSGRGPYVLAIMLGITGVLAFSSFLYIEKNAANGEQNPNSIFSKMVALVHHKKPTALTEDLKVASTKKSAPAEKPPVQFDFYNELPNMQMPKDEEQTAAAQAPATPVVATTVAAITPQPVAPTPPEPVTEVAEAQAPLSPNEPVFTPVTAPAVAEATAAKTVTKTVVAKAANSDTIFNADEVSELLAAEHGLERYVIQLGVFQSEQAANRLREAIVSVGFEATVVPVKQGNRKVYHVQQGPYESVALAKQSQQRMVKRGIISSIQKASA